MTTITELRNLDFKNLTHTEFLYWKCVEQACLNVFKITDLTIVQQMMDALLSDPDTRDIACHTDPLSRIEDILDEDITKENLREYKIVENKIYEN